MNSSPLPLREAGSPGLAKEWAVEAEAVAAARIKAVEAWAEEPEVEDLVKGDKAWEEELRAGVLARVAGDKEAGEEAEGERKRD